MLNYLMAEFYRIFSKKSLYLYFGILLGLYLLMVFIQSANLSIESVPTQSDIVFTMLSLLGGGYLFATIYNDDLHAKALPQLIGFGKRRLYVVMYKTIMMILTTIILFGMGILIFNLLFKGMGIHFNEQTQRVVFNTAMSYGLKTIAFSIVASIFVYGVQKPTTSIVIFVLLASNFISGILSLMLNTLGTVGEQISKFSIHLITITFITDPQLSTFMPYLIYIGFFSILSFLAFTKKDLEF